jgi:hypothetical protein
MKTLQCWSCLERLKMKVAKKSGLKVKNLRLNITGKYVKVGLKTFLLSYFTAGHILFDF